VLGASAAPPAEPPASAARAATAGAAEDVATAPPAEPVAALVPQSAAALREAATVVPRPAPVAPVEASAAADPSAGAASEAVDPAPSLVSQAPAAPPSASPHGPAGARTGRSAADEGAESETEHAALDLGASDTGADVAPVRKVETMRSETLAGPVGQAVETARPAQAGPSLESVAALPPAAPDGAKPDGIAKAEAAPASTPAHDTAPRWSERVADAIRLSSARGGGEIRLQLDPEGLGHIDVRLHLQSDGVRAVIVAEHESTRALLTSQQQVLEQAFARSDLRLSGFSVDVGSGHGSALPDSASARDDDPDATARASTRPDGGSRAEPAASVLPEGRVSVRV
jgi:flagellar hook-length control protein FliK